MPPRQVPTRALLLAAASLSAAAGALTCDDSRPGGECFGPCDCMPEIPADSGCSHDSSATEFDSSADVAHDTTGDARGSGDAAEAGADVDADAEAVGDVSDSGDGE